MSEDGSRPPSRNLKALLRKAGLLSASGEQGQRLVTFPGSYRDWTVIVALNEHLFTAGLFICAVPGPSSLRAELFETILQMNRTIAIAKFSLADHVMLEAEYHADDIDAETIGRLIRFLVVMAEAHYPRLFRIASGDALLKALARNSAL